METQNIPVGLQYPTSNTQEVLLTMITKGRVSIMDYPKLSGFRTRCSELSRKHGLNFKTIMDTRHNKFSRPYSYAVHILEDKEKAIEIYKKLSKTNS